MKKIILISLIGILSITSRMAFAGWAENFDKQQQQQKEYANKCPGVKPWTGSKTALSKTYLHSTQKNNARPECIHPEYQLDVGRIPLVNLGEYMMSTYSRHSHILSTGFWPCIAITFYDPVTKTGVLGHLFPGYMDPQFPRDMDRHDPMFFENILSIFDKLGIPRERIRAGAYGSGSPTQLDISKKLVSVFQNGGLKNITIESINDVEHPKSIQNFKSFKIFDLKDGSIKHFRDVDPNLLDCSQCHRSKDEISDGVVHMRPVLGSLDTLIKK